jgi:hypothetical protein
LHARTKFEYPSAITTVFLRVSALVLSKVLRFIRYRGKHNIPHSSRGFVAASNRSTYLDPAWLSIPIRSKIRYMAWDHAMKWSVLGPIIPHLGAFPVKHRTHITKLAVAELFHYLRTVPRCSFSPKASVNLSTESCSISSPGGPYRFARRCSDTACDDPRREQDLAAGTKVPEPL